MHVVVSVIVWVCGCDCVGEIGSVGRAALIDIITVYVSVNVCGCACMGVWL